MNPMGHFEAAEVALHNAAQWDVGTVEYAAFVGEAHTHATLAATTCAAQLLDVQKALLVAFEKEKEASQ